MKSLVLLLGILGYVAARDGVGPGDQDWGFVTVRPGAHMFYWLYYNEQTTAQPLVIWLQGGPGASSTGFGNFQEIGIVDINLNVRNTSWVNHVNLLFIDNPVGTGFSYVDNTDALCTTNAQIAEDLVTFTSAFLDQYPQFKTVPLYIFSESYGGKMAAEFALALDKAIKDGTVDVPLKGVGLGDSWISPIDSVLTWAPFLLETGMIDSEGYKAIDESAQATKTALDAGKYEDATNLWGQTEGVVGSVTNGVDFYNILTKITGSPFSKTRRWLSGSKDKKYPVSVRDFILKRQSRDDDADLEIFMNHQVKEALGIPDNVVWGGQGGDVFGALYADFMKPVTTVVEQLLTDTDLTVCVFSGQLDLIVDTPGTLKWVENLQWTGSADWASATRQSVYVNGYVEAYRKTYGNLKFYWILRSGHMVPEDNPYAALQMLQEVTNYT